MRHYATWKGATGPGVLVALLCCAPTGLGQEAYDVVPVPTLGGATNSATALNDAGRIVGSSSLDMQPGGDSHAYLWDPATAALIDLDTLGGSNSIAYAINESDQVTGYSELAGGVQHAFFWDSGVLTDLVAGFPASFSSGWGINDTGVVAGHLGSAAFVWNGGLIDPGTLGFPTRAYGINNASAVVGESGLRAFIWQDDGNPATADLRELGPLPGGLARTRARGINNAGQVVGEAHFGSSDLEDYDAVLWQNLSWDASENYTGDVINLGTLPGGLRSFARAINDSGQVVGYAMASGIGSPHAFVWDAAHGMRDLNDLIPSGSGWLLQWAFDVNQAGQIVGLGFLNGTSRGFLLTPVVPLPGDLNCDGMVDMNDSTAMVGVLLGTDADPCHVAAADMNGDGAANGEDIPGFMAALLSP